MFLLLWRLLLSRFQEMKSGCTLWVHQARQDLLEVQVSAGSRLTPRRWLNASTASWIVSAKFLLYVQCRTDDLFCLIVGLCLSPERGALGAPGAPGPPGPPGPPGNLLASKSFNHPRAQTLISKLFDITALAFSFWFDLPCSSWISVSYRPSRTPWCTGCSWATRSAWAPRTARIWELCQLGHPWLPAEWVQTGNVSGELRL